MRIRIYLYTSLYLHIIHIVHMFSIGFASSLHNTIFHTYGFDIHIFFRVSYISIDLYKLFLTFIYIFIYKSIHIYTYKCVHIDGYLHIDICIYMFVHICTIAYVYTYLHIFLCVCVYIYMLSHNCV